MAPRLSRSSIPASKPKKQAKPRRKNQKRTLNAFSIASQEHPDRPKIRQSRLGDVDDEDQRQKRRRNEDSGSAGEEGPSRKKVAKGRFDELDVSEGSDSEGNTWRMGDVDDEDDSDVDSDEAFGESDEERFEGFAFRGSSSNAKPKRKTKNVPKENANLDLNEGHVVDGEDDGDSDSLGDEAVDLATMLDGSDDDTSDRPSPGDEQADASDESGSDEERGDAFSESDTEDADEDADGMDHLLGIINAHSVDKKGRKPDDQNSSKPSRSGSMLTAMAAVVTDPEVRTSTKLTRDGAKGTSTPLPKRQQDRIDRIAASKEAKMTLNRWVDTVKHNRRAEHLFFPLKDPSASEPHGASRLLSTTESQPFNDLEGAIQNILQESGLASSKDEEKQFQEFEELQTNKMPLQEVQARQAELRKARELLFREELKSKRIKKIKSKSYRRVHRKERDKAAQHERDALAAAGVDVSEDERELNDRRRAEERVGAKHRESKWAKSVKKTGRAAWDEDARSGVTEMARRNEELRRRIAGEAVRNEDEDISDISSGADDDDDDGFLDPNANGKAKLQRQLDRLDESQSADTGVSKLGSMKFMKNAEAARKKRNDEDVERMRREIAGEDSADEVKEPEEFMGRKIFGPGLRTKKNQEPTPKESRNEFEERPDSEEEADDNADDVNFIIEPNAHSKEVRKTSQFARNPQKTTDDHTGSTYSATKSKMSKEISAAAPAPARSQAKASKLDDTATASAERNGPVSPVADAKTDAGPDADGWMTVTYKNGNEDEYESDASKDSAAAQPILPSSSDLVKRVFGGDDTISTSFANEKAAAAADEGLQTVSNALPGWGSWVGEGLSKAARKQQERNKARFVTKTEGVKPEARKDAKMKNVIVSQKRVRKNSKYLAKELPHPYENAMQYERSLRMPLGKEWQTREVVGRNTMPRVVVKRGSVITPMKKPMV